MMDRIGSGGHGLESDSGRNLDTPEEASGRTSPTPHSARAPGPSSCNRRKNGLTTWCGEPTQRSVAPYTFAKSHTDVFEKMWLSVEFGRRHTRDAKKERTSSMPVALNAAPLRACGRGRLTWVCRIEGAS